MRIVDKKNKDYYDGIQRNGQDLTCVYIRKQETIEIPRFDLYIRKQETIEIPRFDCDGFCDGVRPLHIGFCGEIYPVLHIEPERHSELKQPFLYGEGHCYHPNPDDFYYSAEKAFDAYKDAWEKDWRWRRHNLNRTDAEKHLADFFNYKPKVLEPIFREHRVPIFVTHDYGGWHHDAEIGLNPLLKYYGFQRVVDPYQCFQKIHGFMSGVLGPEQKPIPEIDDETKVAIHGMDKFSFRMDKGTKPSRKSKRKKK
jgi:hypothetical protein